MTKIHVLADETLGGIKREYVEVDEVIKYGRKALYKGKVREITYVGHGCASLDGRIHLPIVDIVLLEPTDIVHITSNDGKSERFRLVDRKAEVGERVIIVTEGDGWYEGKAGKVFEVINPTHSGFGGEHTYVDVETNNAGRCSFISREHYRVLVPVESETSPQTTDDIIANLVARVAQLERENKAMLDVYERGQKWTHERINGVKDDIETWAQEHENAKHELDDKIEMCIDDIVTLDERLIATEGRTEHVNSIKARRCCGCK